MSSSSGNTGDNRSDASGFFSVGAPLHAVRAGYIRRRADDLLVEAAMAGRYAHVIAPDRTGKSSLVASSAAHLENNGFRVAILDLEQIGARETEIDAGRWYYNVAYRLLRQLRIRFDLQDWWQDKSILSNRQRLQEFYSEILLGQTDGRIVVFIDAVQRADELNHGEQLLASVRSAFDARSADPEFTRLTFVLVGSGDPALLVSDEDASPFSITQAIPLDDFSRDDLDLYGPEINVPAEFTAAILDRVYYWTGGHPYLTQKLCRAISRVGVIEDPDELVDKLVLQQFGGPAATQNEPHLACIHSNIVADKAMCEGLLNLYGKIRKGVEVSTDLGSPLQRKLIAVGLLVTDELGGLRIRNHVYELVFTARWANENLPIRWRVPAIAASVVLLMLAIPFWYTQLLPNPYLRVLMSEETDLQTAQETWLNMRSFPGHTEAADSVFRQLLERRAEVADEEQAIQRVVTLASSVPNSGNLPQRLVAEFWDRKTDEALRYEDREAALLASIQSFALSSRLRRSRAAMLVADDLPLLTDTLRLPVAGGLRFDALNQVISLLQDARVEQWRLGARGLQASGSWNLTALEISPLVRRIFVDATGNARQIGLSVNVSHQRFQDLSIKIIAPSGKSADVTLDAERSSSNDSLRVPTEQLRALIGEPLRGTWSISLRDEAMGFGGHLVGWNLNLNSQGLVENFERGLNIPDPVEVPATRLWVGEQSRFAVVGTAGSESVRVWDLAFAKPLGAVSLPGNEEILGVAGNGQQLVTATQESVHAWDIDSGRSLLSMPVDSGGSSISLLDEGSRLLVRKKGDQLTRYELWPIDGGREPLVLSLAGTPAADAASADGSILAVADADRAVRVWRFGQDELLAQFNLPYQPKQILLSPDGQQLGVVYDGTGVAQYSVSNPDVPVFEDMSEGRWAFSFSPSGTYSVSGHPGLGYQIRSSADGRLQGPLLGEHPGSTGQVLAFSQNEQILLTPAGPDGIRIWRVPPRIESSRGEEHAVWSPALDGDIVVSPDAALIATADRSGHVHILKAGDDLNSLDDATEDVSYLGHNATIRHLAMSQRAGVAASVGDDDQLRFWELDSGLPSESLLDIGASQVTKLVFSPSGRQLALLLGSRVLLVDVESARLVQEIDFLEPQTDLIYVTEKQFFSAGISGALQSASRADSGAWSIAQIWNGGVAIAALALSRDGGRMIVADEANRLQQINLQSSELRPQSISLPSRILDVEFSPVGSRVLVRTERWMHALSSTPAGLQWSNAVLLPRIPGGANIAFDVQSVRDFFLPVVTDGRVRLERFSLNGASSETLIGNQKELLADWQRKLGLLPIAGSGS